MIHLFFRNSSEHFLTELIRRISENSASNRQEIEQLFRYLVNYVAPKLKNKAKQLGIEKTEREDIVQEVFKKTFSNLPFKQFENITSLEGYIWRIFFNDINKFFQTHKKLEELIGDFSIEELDEFGEEISEAIADTLKWLDEKCSKILKMKYMQGIEFVKIAAELGFKENTLIQQAKRCREKAKGYFIDKYKNLVKWKI